MSTVHQHIKPTQPQRTPQHEIQSAKAYPSRTIIHAKLEMTEPGDHDEQEADAVANTIVSGGKIARKISSGGGSSGIAVSQQMESQLSQLQGGGRQMPDGLRNMMESGFGRDFSQVRLHTDSEAASMSSSIHAKAFTFGNDIYFNQGQFSPNTTAGQRLVAHELTHVVQGGDHIKRLPWKKFPCQYNYMVQDLMSGGAIKDSTEAVTDEEEKKDSTEPQETDFEKLKRIVTSGDENALIDHLIFTAIQQDKYQAKKKLDIDDQNQIDALHEKTSSYDGSGKYTMYQYDLKQDWALGKDWCDWFVHWCFVKAFHPDFTNIRSNQKAETIRDNILRHTMYETQKMLGDVASSIKAFGINAYFNEKFDIEHLDERCNISFKTITYKGKKGNKLTFQEKDEYLHKMITEYNQSNDKAAVEKKYNCSIENAQDWMRYKRRYNELKTNNKNQKEKDKLQIKKGDVIFFTGHIGLVIKVTPESIFTMEGNTGSAKLSFNESTSEIEGQNKGDKDTVVARGNGAYIRAYGIDSNNILGFGHPDYAGLLKYLKDEVYSQPSQEPNTTP